MENSDRGLTTRVETMDRHLKAAFNDVKAFTAHAVAALEERQNARFDTLEGRFDTLEGRFDALEGRFDTLEGRFDTLDGRFDTLEGRFGTLEGRFGTLEGRFGALEGRFDTLERTVKAGFQVVDRRLGGIDDRVAQVSTDIRKLLKRTSPPRTPARRRRRT